jgi:hypothetical protein
VCVCVREREKEREKATERERESAEFVKKEEIDNEWKRFCMC